MKFKAAVLNKVNAPLTLDTLEMGPLAPTDVLVKLKATGLCHTDLEVIQGSLAYPLPIVLGHEGAGIVEAVGEAVTQVKPGDHVICSWNPHCGHCFYCERDLPILCEPFARHQPRGFLLDGRSRMTRGGEQVHHYSVTSTHAEYTVIPESGAIPVPKELPFDRACIIGCGVMTGVGAAVRKAKVAAGESVAVIGCGAVGLNAIQGAKLVDAGRIIAVDVGPAKLERARLFGATDVVDGAAAGAVEQVKALTGGRGADCVIEAAGNRNTFRLSVEMVRPGGQVVWLGKVNVNEDVSFRWGSLMGEKRIVRSSYGEARPRRDFPWLAQEYLRGRLKLDELITGRIRLDQINEGFASLARGEGIRTVVMLD
ncbi:MAG TPA: Zn-dependent alcohol dehydrogenase [Burkholderiales bacterium]|jgi:S-(hydroxymethyl)glutathione dehydrogenase/alcohol dehydrogenase|nr:Zn-dependent alcohol dehydrogenase [Burkholderiales bacterium]